MMLDRKTGELYWSTCLQKSIAGCAPPLESCCQIYSRIGLSEIDFRTIGDGKTGPATRKIQHIYHDAIRGKLPKYESWCEYVDKG